MTWNKEFLVGMWTYTTVGSGEKSTEGLLCPHLMGLKYVQVTGANSRGENCM